MKLARKTAWLCLGFLVCVSSARAVVYPVGPSQAYATINSVPLNSLLPGDVVQVYAGTYNEIVKFNANGAVGNPITIIGMGATKPIVDGTGINATGAGSVPRALFQFNGSNWVVDNFELRNGGNDSGNGAGVRVTGGNNVTIQNCHIHDNMMGIMSDTCSGLLFQYCEINYNGALGSGPPHNVYVGGGTQDVTARFCYIHEAPQGFNFKSRAHSTFLLYNYILNSENGEVDLCEDADTAVPNSNAALIGNVIVSKANRTGNNGYYVQFGSDGGSSSHSGTCWVVNNTMIAGDARNKFLDSSSPDAMIIAENNIMMGSDQIVYPSASNGYPANVSGSNNWLPATATVPANFLNSVLGAAPGFVNAAGANYHLLAGSACIGQAALQGNYLDGNGNPQPALPLDEYVQNLTFTARASALDLGAYEFAKTPSPSPTVMASSPTPTAPRTPTSSGTQTILPSATKTATPTRTSSPVSSLTRTPAFTGTYSRTAAPSLPATPSASPTASATAKSSPTAGLTPVASPTGSPAIPPPPSQSATPSRTATVAASTATAASSKTQTPRPSPTATFSAGIIPPSPHPSPSFTSTATGTLVIVTPAGTMTPGAQEPARVEKAIPVPNPQSGPSFRFGVRLSSGTDQIQLRLYTKAMERVGQCRAEGNFRQGWNSVEFKMTGPGAGLYYAVLIAGDLGGDKHGCMAKLLVLP